MLNNTMDAINRAAKARVVSAKDIKALIDNLSLERKERLIAEVIASLPEESRRRLNLERITVVTGEENFAVNAQLCIQIQNAPNVDLALILEAAALRHRRERLEHS
ncbi:hypothetical protein B4U84_28630 [Westiellopsis prolifica IICB1]|nr:hypothetical protein B4U84_28630 [Westiellopsis prolifica IICB1]